MATLPSTDTTKLPSLIPHQTLHNPSLGTKSWASQPHPDPSTPLLATAVSDKSVHVWNMRDWKLVSTINGGHKRSIRCVGWKDYGVRRKRRRSQDGGDDHMQTDTNDGADKDAKRPPVLLATGSFDANCGLWVWNRERSQAGINSGARDDGVEAQRSVPGAFGEDDDGDDMVEQDFTNLGANDEADADEEWHFSTLLTGPDSEIKDLQFSPAHYGAGLLATCSRDKSVWVWEEVEPEEWETVAVLSEHTGDVKCLAWLAGAKTTKRELKARIRSRKETVGAQNSTGQSQSFGTADVESTSEEDDEEIILGGRELLASGAYDDTIRLHHDDEAEGDWMTIAVLTGHDGTIWDLNFESYINLSSYPNETTVEEIVADWSPRLLSCSDDMTIRVWQKDLNAKEKDERLSRIAEARRGQNQNSGVVGSGDGTVQTGFSGTRLPSVIRSATSTERWSEESRLPEVHVRSIYAVDWSARTGLIVSCGGDGVIAVYREVPVISPSGSSNTQTLGTTGAGSEDVVMNGTPEDTPNVDAAQQEADIPDPNDIQKVKTEWKVVAMLDAAHDEYEVNHVCWAGRRDQKARGQSGAGEEIGTSENEDKEYIISTGDDGEVKAWRLPEEVLKEVV